MVPREMKGRGEADDGVDGYRSKKRGREGGGGTGGRSRRHSEELVLG